MMHYRLTLFLLCIIFNSCQNYDKPIEISTNDFSITLPGFVKEDELAPDAIIEYANRYRNFYIAIFELPQTSSIDSIWQLSSQRVSQFLIKPEIDTHRINNTIITHIKGNIKDEKLPIFYTQKLMYHPEKSYLLTIWTRGDERRKKHEDTINQILESFKSKK